MSVFLKVDRLYLRLYPVWIIALWIGALCGAVFLVMGIGAYFGLLDPGADFGSTDPAYIAAAGAAIILGTIMGGVKLRKDRRAALARVKAAEEVRSGRGRIAS